MKYVKMLRRDGVVFDNIFRLDCSLNGLKTWYIVVYAQGKLIDTYSRILYDENCDLLIVDTKTGTSLWVALEYVDVDEIFGYYVSSVDYAVFYFYNEFLDFLDSCLDFSKDNIVNSSEDLYNIVGILCRETDSLEYIICDSMLGIKCRYSDYLQIKNQKRLDYFKMKFAKIQLIGGFRC